VDESAIWDDPDEATRKLSHHDIARTLSSATDLSMEWDEDESTTHTYSPHLLSPAMLLQASQASPAKKDAPRPQSSVRQKAVVTKPKSRASGAAVANLLNAERERSVSLESRRGPSKNTFHAARTGKPTAARSGAPVVARTAAPVAARQVSKSVAPKSVAPVLKRPVPKLERSAPTAVATPNVVRSVVRLDPRPLRTQPPPLPAAAVYPTPQASSETAGEHAWTQAWEEAQALVRANQGAPQASPPAVRSTQAAAPQPVRPRLRSDGPTMRNFPPPAAILNAEPHNLRGYAVRGDAPSYAETVLPPAAAVQELRTAHATGTHSTSFDDDFESASLDRSEVKRLLTFSAIPALALFFAVLAGRVLLAGPVAPVLAPVQPEATPAATAAPSAPVEPQIEEPAPAAVQAAPQAPRTTNSSGHVGTTSSSTRAKRTSTESTRSDEDVSAPRSSRTREDSSGQDEAKAAPVEQVERAAPAAATPTTPTSGIGILRLNSRPWSQVFVDGKLIGNTPQMGLRLSAGSHEIALANQQLGMSKKIHVDIVADEITTRIVTLEE
jgi:hypothetical protein